MLHIKRYLLIYHLKFDQEECQGYTTHTHKKKLHSLTQNTVLPITSTDTVLHLFSSNHNDE